MSGGPIEISLADLVARVLDESGMEQSLRSNAQEEDIDRVANLQELVSAASERELEQDAAAEVDAPASLAGRLASWLESITLVADADMIDPEQGAVTLMSLHASKGLEFDVVAIVACEQGVLPHARALDDIGQMEEERRLCYVGMTRARKHLLMGHANSRTQRGQHERMSPSRFLDEIPSDSVCQIHADDSWQVNQVVEITVHVGQPVRHPRFGLGRVLRLGRRPQGATITVDFVEFGPRTLPASHASLEPTGNCDIDF